MEVTVFVSDGAMFCGEVRVCDDDIAVGSGAEDIFAVIDSEVFAAMVTVLRDDPADDGFGLFEVEGIEVEGDCFFAGFLWYWCAVDHGHGGGWSAADLTDGSAAEWTHIPIGLKS